MSVSMIFCLIVAHVLLLDDGADLGGICFLWFISYVVHWLIN